MTQYHSHKAPQRDAPIRVTALPGNRGYLLKTAMRLPQPLERVFAFFADATQLETLTPAWLHFRVATPGPIQIMEGTVLDYRLRLHGFPLRWQSRITAWEPPLRFVDEQTRGPYRHWRHEHVFQPIEGGTLCSDCVHYQVPCGRLVEQLIVRPDLKRIFQFRRRKLAELFDAGTTVPWEA